MAKPVADTDSGGNQGGFTLDGANVTGFSNLHDSGTGSTPSLGNFALFPYSECPGDDIDRCVYPKNQRKLSYVDGSVGSTPGYFKLQLASGITADMTAAQHTSLFRFQFPERNDSAPFSPLILMDLTDLSNSRQNNASISVDDSTGQMTGNGRFIPSFGKGNYVVYFCADFLGNDVRDTGIFVNSRAGFEPKNLTINNSGGTLPGGAFVRFNSLAQNTILARVGVSYISSEQACASALNEIPDFDFTRVQTEAENAWRTKINPVQVSTTGVDNSTLTNFFSGIYRTMINPQNYTGENPLWETSVDNQYFDSFYCLWDSFRSQLPFLTILDPAALSRMIQSLIETQQNVGYLPDCRMSLCKGITQGGSNADNVLTDAYLKGIRDSFIDWDAGYAAVVKDAEVEPFDWFIEGRGGLASWKSLNYIPVEDFDPNGFGTMTRSVSRTLEYAYNDFSISNLASALGGHDDDVAKYQNRSRAWENLYYPNQTSALFNGTDTGFTGFFQAKYLNGTWDDQNPLTCSNIDNNPPACSLQASGQETDESSLWEYGFFVPHDQARLITTYGGDDAFVRRLEYLHDTNITYIGNEPAFLTVFQYHYAGRPALSARRAHYYIPAFFSPTPGGLPGNDDSGAMGSFLAFTMMGLFPNPGQDVYLILPPFFEEVSVTNPVSGATATVRNVGFDPTYNAIYIQNATLDGVPYTKNWVDHSFFAEGKELVLTLGMEESTWGAAVEDRPPSLSTMGADTTRA
ncbi:MAG: hypothetical protein Q9160_006689 [Pyrenula sp. 1 TL-2023]